MWEGLAPDGGLTAEQDAGTDRVHIHYSANGRYGFRPYGGSLRIVITVDCYKVA